MKPTTIAALGLITVLTGCASTQLVPYWENPQWINALGATVHKDIQYPKDAARGDFPSGTAIVEFTYDNGKLRAPRILKSTGSKILDAAIVEQIPTIRPPEAHGPNARTSHDFEMEVGLAPVDIGLFAALHHDLAAHSAYPRQAVLNGHVGTVTAHFKYRNGEVFDLEIVKSSGHPELDQAVLHELRTIPYPKPPDWLKDKTFSFQVPFCFGMGKALCRNSEMRVSYVTTGTASNPAKLPCAVIGYRYADGRISKVHLIESSGDAALDKRALMEASQGKFPRPTTRWERAVSDYTIPVCNNGGSEPSSPNTGGP